MSLADLMPLAVIVAGTGLIVGTGILARHDDPGDTYNVDDYRPPTEEDRLIEAFRRSLAQPYRTVILGPYEPQILPPIPAPVTERCPAYVDTIVAQVLRRYGGSPSDIAGRWLAEIGAEQREAVR